MIIKRKIAESESWSVEVRPEVPASTPQMSLFVRSISRELIHRAKVAALNERISLQAWITRAIERSL